MSVRILGVVLATRPAIRAPDARPCMVEWVRRPSCLQPGGLQSFEESVSAAEAQ